MVSQRRANSRFVKNKGVVVVQARILTVTELASRPPPPGGTEQLKMSMIMDDLTISTGGQTSNQRTPAS